MCLTATGIVRLVVRAPAADRPADDLPALDAVFFLVACLLSHWAVRTRNLRRMHRVERVADAVFLFGLFSMVLACALMTYEIL